MRLPAPATEEAQIAGAGLFLATTAVWMLSLTLAEMGKLGKLDDTPETLVWCVALVLSAVSLIATGYLLGTFSFALVFVWVPGVVMTAIGFGLDPEPGGDETGGGFIFLGPIVATFGAAFFLIPIGLGVLARRWRGTVPAA